LQSCTDNMVWRDSKKGKGCSAWEGHDCSKQFNGYDDPKIVIRQCPKTCNQCEICGVGGGDEESMAPTQVPSGVPTLFPTACQPLLSGTTATPTQSASPTLVPSGTPSLNPTLAPLNRLSPQGMCEYVKRPNHLLPDELPRSELGEFRQTRFPTFGAADKICSSQPKCGGVIQTTDGTFHPMLSVAAGGGKVQQTAANITLFECTWRHRATGVPSNNPSKSPTLSPTDCPTSGPVAPTHTPTVHPTALPSFSPFKWAPAYTPSPTTIVPTFSPTAGPTVRGSVVPTLFPSHTPSRVPTSIDRKCNVFEGSFKMYDGPQVDLPKIAGLPVKVNWGACLAACRHEKSCRQVVFNKITGHCHRMRVSSSREQPHVPDPSIYTSAHCCNSVVIRPRTQNPTLTPTLLPSLSPTDIPTDGPSDAPSAHPTLYPTLDAKLSWSGTWPPTLDPTRSPTDSPTHIPSYAPSVPPTLQPTAKPSPGTQAPTLHPSTIPTETPTLFPSLTPTDSPTIAPSDSDLFPHYLIAWFGLNECPKLHRADCKTYMVAGKPACKYTSTEGCIPRVPLTHADKAKVDVT
jgi:hypothetical protein